MEDLKLTKAIAEEKNPNEWEMMNTITELATGSNWKMKDFCTSSSSFAAKVLKIQTLSPKCRRNEKGNVDNKTMNVKLQMKKSSKL